MHADIVDLRAFYNSMLGRLAERSIAMALSAIWAQIPNERLVGLGYALPWLERFGTDAERVFAFMPAAQGAVRWPPEGPSATALVFDEELPLPDSSIDRILMIHSLEHAENPAETLTEMWRVLAPNGRLLIVVPNRRGIWARVEKTPFGYGRPFSRGQLTTLLRDAQFSGAAWSGALFAPPFANRFLLRNGRGWDRAGAMLWPAFAGVLIVEATKLVYQTLPVRSRSRGRRVPALRPALIPPG